MKISKQAPVLLFFIISCSLPHTKPSYLQIDSSLLTNMNIEVAEPHFEPKDNAQRIRYFNFMQEILLQNKHTSSVLLRENAVVRANEFFSHIIKEYDLGLATNKSITIRWDVFNNDAGFVLSGEERIVHLNETMFVFNYHHFMQEIIPHEVIHIVENELGVTKRHGFHSDIWREIMRREVKNDHTKHKLEALWVCKARQIIFQTKPRNIQFCLERLRTLSKEISLMLYAAG